MVLEADLWAYQVDAYTIKRLLYVERMTAGTTKVMAVRKQVPPYFKPIKNGSS